VGFWDWLIGNNGGTAADVIAEPFPSVSTQIAAYAALRQVEGVRGPGASYMALPAVERGVSLLASAVAQMNPLAYRDGLELDEQPRIVNRPDPWTTRYTFLFQTVRSMVESADGVAYWYLFDKDPETGRPRAARVIDPAEVTAGWDAMRFLPTYTWRGRQMKPGVDLAVIPLAPRVGSPVGVSPLAAAAPVLWAIEAAERYAAGFFAGGAMPSGTLMSEKELTADEAQVLLDSWLDAHSGTPTPAVLSGGITWHPEGSDPDKSQLVETREQGVATVARLLGIPAPLLIVAVTGTSIQYANVNQLYLELVRSTVAPLYLAPIEAAWSDLTPRGTVVRFDVGELQRADIEARFRIYQQAMDMGVLTVDDISRAEGVSSRKVPTVFAPTAMPSVTVPEVPG
jgi:HK97 family phage portal protein